MELFKKNIGDYLDVLKTPIVLLISLSVIQFVVRVIGYFLKNGIIRILGWVILAFMGLFWLLILIYVSWIVVHSKRWDAMNTLFAGVIFGLIGGLVVGIGLVFGNIVALILSDSWTLFKVGVWSVVIMVLIPITMCVFGGFISGIIGILLENRG